MVEQMENLSLLEEEDDSWTIHGGGEEEKEGKVELALVGRFLTDRPVRTHIMKERMAGM